MKGINQAKIARMAGVSPATVSRVINNSGYVSQEVRKAVEDAISASGYISESAAYSKKQRRVGLFYPGGMLSPLYSHMSQYIQSIFADEDYYVIAANSPSICNKTICYHTEKLRRIGICGLIFCGFVDDKLEDETRELLNSCGFPIIFVEGTDNCYGFDRIFIDNTYGTYQAARCLISKGHKHLLYVSRNMKYEVARMRERGFLRAISEAKSADIKHQIKYCVTNDPHSGYIATKEAYEKDPLITGIVGWEDIVTIGIQQYVMRNLSDVFDSIEIIGHDNVLAPYYGIPVNSIDMPFREIAYSALETIKRQVESNVEIAPRTVTLEPKLILCQ